MNIIEKLLKQKEINEKMIQRTEKNIMQELEINTDNILHKILDPKERWTRDILMRRSQNEIIDMIVPQLVTVSDEFSLNMRYFTEKLRQNGFESKHKGNDILISAVETGKVSYVLTKEAGFYNIYNLDKDLVIKANCIMELTDKCKDLLKRKEMLDEA